MTLNESSEKYNRTSPLSNPTPAKKPITLVYSAPLSRFSYTNPWGCRNGRTKTPEVPQ